MILVVLTFLLILAIIIIYRIGINDYGNELSVLNKKEYKFGRLMSIGLLLIDRTTLKNLVEKPHYQILHLYPRQRYKEKTRYFEAERLTLIIFIIMGSFLIATILIIKASMVQEIYELSKKEFNEGVYTKQLYYEVTSNNKKIKDKINVTVPEQYPNETQKEDILKALLSNLPTLILNEDTSLNHVSHPLNLIETYYNNQIRIIWESKNKKLLLNNGEIRYNNLTKEGEKVELNADIECYGIKESVSYTVIIFNKVISQKENINESIKNLIEQSRIEQYQNTFKLPNQVLKLGATIKWFNGDKSVSISKILVIGILASILIYHLKAYEVKVSLKNRKEELLKEFPACINKLTLLINAGMTFKRAWEKIVNDYIKYKSHNSTILIYEEMLLTLEDINKGMPEIKAYEAFGQRCQIPEVFRFVALVIQNIRKGSHLLINAMQQQSKEALSLRQDLVRKKGEKASTKLIFPMGIMFLAILIIIITPAIITLKL